MADYALDMKKQFNGTKVHYSKYEYQLELIK